MKLLMEAIQILSDTLDPVIKDRICFVYSSKNGSKYFDGIPFRTTSLGYMNFNKELPLAFIASDAHISSSIMDTGPYMVNLSIAYGCPVLSFDIGVAINLVVNGVTGFKANETSANLLADAITLFLNLKNKEIQMDENCIRLAKEKLYWKDSSLKIFGLE